VGGSCEKKARKERNTKISALPDRVLVEEHQRYSIPNIIYLILSVKPLNMRGDYRVNPLNHESLGRLDSATRIA